jgi:hypothetical protein
VAAISVLGSDSISNRRSAAQAEVATKGNDREDYFFGVVRRHHKESKAKLPTSNHEVWDQTRERLQQAVRNTRAKHEASMTLLAERNERTLKELQGLRDSHKELNKHPNLLRESAFEVMTLRAQSEEVTAQAVQRMRRLM